MKKVFEKIIEKQKELFQDLNVIEVLSHVDFDSTIQNSLENFLKAITNEAIEIVKQEAEKCKLYDTISIHTNGLEEGIRCAVCTNQIKSDTGCDGGCCVDENLVKRICDVIHKFECKPYQPKGE